MKKLDIKARANQLMSDVPAVFLALKDKNTPVIAKVLAFLTVAYALSPIDLIPDFIPVVGYLDDLIILPALIALTIRFIPKDVWQKHRAAAAGLWQNGSPKKWYYTLPIIAAWLIIIAIIIKAAFL